MKKLVFRFKIFYIKRKFIRNTYLTIKEFENYRDFMFFKKNYKLNCL